MDKGVKKICKMFGAITYGGEKYLWDYANNKIVPEEQMKFGSARHRESELARYMPIKES